ncbi:MAG: primosomal replication protein N [Oxalobacter formigenes]|nr:primosomal replication protein N [Oxalobacter formigenes]
MENRLQLIACLIERDIVRFTPAGIPIVTALLQHCSRQTEAETERLVELEIPAMAIGKIANELDKLETGKIQCFTGFLAKKSRNSKSLVFHITDITSITDQNKLLIQEPQHGKR